MIGRRLLVLTVLLAMVPAASADHDQGCVPTSADPATVNNILLPDGSLIYVEERGVPAPFNAVPVPGSGFLLADGTWIYEESNGVGGLQRGSLSFLPCFPTPDICLFGIDPYWDENCGHGPDTHKF